QPGNAVKIFFTSTPAMLRFDYLQNALPKVVLFRVIRSIGNGRAGLIFHGQARDLVASSAITRVPKARMIGIKLNDLISIRRNFVWLCSDETRVGMISQQVDLLIS